MQIYNFRISICMLKLQKEKETVNLQLTLFECVNKMEFVLNFA